MSPSLRRIVGLRPTGDELRQLRDGDAGRQAAHEDLLRRLKVEHVEKPPEAQIPVKEFQAPAKPLTKAEEEVVGEMKDLSSNGVGFVRMDYLGNGMFKRLGSIEAPKFSDKGYVPEPAAGQEFLCTSDGKTFNFESFYRPSAEADEKLRDFCRRAGGEYGGARIIRRVA